MKFSSSLGIMTKKGWSWLPEGGGQGEKNISVWPSDSPLVRKKLEFRIQSKSHQHTLWLRWLYDRTAWEGKQIISELLLLLCACHIYSYIFVDSTNWHTGLVHKKIHWALGTNMTIMYTFSKEIWNGSGVSPPVNMSQMDHLSLSSPSLHFSDTLLVKWENHGKFTRAGVP